MPWLRRYVFDTLFNASCENTRALFLEVNIGNYPKKAQKRTNHYTATHLLVQISSSASGSIACIFPGIIAPYSKKYPPLNRGYVILCREYEEAAKRRSNIPTSPNIHTKPSPNNKTMTINAPERFVARK